MNLLMLAWLSHDFKVMSDFQFSNFSSSDLEHVTEHLWASIFGA